MLRGLKGLGLASTAAALACFAIAPHAALGGWLNAAILVQSVPVGALLLLSFMRLIPGPYGDDLRFTCDSASGLWSLAFLAFVPVLLGALFMQEWPRSSIASALPEGWREVLPVTLRTLLWFLALAAIARILVGGQSSRVAAAGTLVVMIVGTSLLAADWLRPTSEGFATVGLGIPLFLLGMVAAGTSLVLLRLARRSEPERPDLLGWMLLVLLLLWLCSAFLFWFAWGGDGWRGPAGSYADPAREPWALLLVAAAALGVMALFMLLLPSSRHSLRVLAWAALLMLPAQALQFAWLAVGSGGAMAVLAFLLALCGLGCQAGSFLAPGDDWHFPGKRLAT